MSGLLSQDRAKRTVLTFAAGLLATLAAHAGTLATRISHTACGRQEMLLDANWHFHLGDVPGSERPESPEDGTWTAVNLPHDWAIAGPISPDNPSGGAGAFAPMGIGWYRQHLLTPPTSCRRRTLVQFDGIMANSDVWINGHLLGHRPNGYVGLLYDLTPYLKPQGGADNLLTVRADNSRQPSSRFYQGAGLYRHVHLLLLPELHLSSWDTSVRTPDISSKAAKVQVSGEIQNDGPGTRSGAVRLVVSDSEGREVGRSPWTAAVTVPRNRATPFSVETSVPHPRLWDIQDPRMYRVRVELAEGKHAIDSEQIPFGIRDAHFEAATGFWLNGRNLKIKGVALHSDIGALGMAAPISLWEHRLHALQALGVNAVRTAHNPVAPEFLDVCDRLGILVLDEFFDQWTIGKNAYDYHLYFRDWYLQDTRDTVRRDRNHPSIVAWSAGNEIHDTPHPEIARPILASLVAVYHQNDPTRPVTQALFRPNVSHDYDDGLADMLDVVGQNYRPNELLAAHAAKPSRKILGTENGHDRANWLAVRDNAPYAGMFLWSGADYLGESRHWPLFADGAGLIDRTDFPKPDALERQSWWSERPVVHLVRRVAPTPKAPTDPGYEAEQYRPKQTAFPDWTPSDLRPHLEHVEAYSNCVEVALTLNGQDLGSKLLPPDASPRTWDVSFAPGALEAHCVENPAVSETLHTAGPAAGLLLTEESEAGQLFDDVALVRLTVVDAHGVPLPGAALPVAFFVHGAAKLLATDDADTAYTVPFSRSARSTLDGRAVAYVRAYGAGEAALQAVSPNLPPASLQLRIKQPVDAVATTRAGATQ